MHRLIMNPAPDKLIDHINGNGLDNRRSNLRICTKLENQRFQGPKDGKKFKGVFLDGRTSLAKRWMASIHVGRKSHHLGRYKTELEAARVYNVAAKKWFGDFAWLNDVSKTKRKVCK